MSSQIVNTKLRAAVVGVGYLGRFHAQKYKGIPNVELAGVCDASSERVEKIAAELGTQAYTQYKDLLGKIDLITIASTTSSHYEIAKFFLQNGIHVNVEKPMTTTSAEGRELCEIAEAKGLKFQVGFVERFNPAFIAAREKFTTPLFIECHRLAPFKPRGADVSVVLDLMIHDLDVILSLVRSRPKTVVAIGTPVLMKTVDIANARIEFESGAVANLTASRVSTKSQRKFRLFQQNQYLSIDFGSGEVNLLTKTGELSGEDFGAGIHEDLPIEAESWSLDKGDALMAETQSFVDSVANNTDPLVTGRDGLNALELAEQIIDAIRK